MTRTLARVLTLTAVLAGGLVGMSSAAQAAPTSCDEHAIFNGYYVYCGRGTGEYRAHVRCYRNHGNDYTDRNGPWRRPNGLHSEVSCRTGEEMADARTQKRG